MRTDLQRRIKALEEPRLDFVEVARSVVPEWLLEEWIAQGQECDPLNRGSVLRAIRGTDRGFTGT